MTKVSKHKTEIMTAAEAEKVQQHIVARVGRAVDIIGEALDGKLDSDKGVDRMKFMAADRLLKYIPLVREIKGNTFNLIFGTPRPDKKPAGKVIDAAVSASPDEPGPAKPEPSIPRPGRRR